MLDNVKKLVNFKILYNYYILLVTEYDDDRRWIKIYYAECFS